VSLLPSGERAPRDSQNSWQRRSFAAVLPLAFVALVAGGGCPEETQPNDDDAPPSCTLAFLGDQSKDPSIELIYFGADQMDHPLVDGGEIDLIFPPQGGRVLFVGVRATNVDPCGVKLTGALRDTSTGQVRLDTRTVNLRDDGSGFGASTPGDIASYANVPVCPNQWSARDAFGESFELEVALTDLRDRTATEVVQVKPRCAEPANEAECLCICQGGYVLGQQCTDPTGSGGGGTGGEGGGGVGGGAGGGL
jgi:hypothetical protein